MFVFLTFQLPHLLGSLSAKEVADFIEEVEKGHIVRNREAVLRLETILAIHECSKLNKIDQCASVMNGQLDPSPDCCFIEYAIPGMAQPLVIKVVGTREKICQQLAQTIAQVNREQQLGGKLALPR